ncbi:MAG: methyltransferase [Segetibacter sp.]|nr:methyltransferase [Segetibacter sp.]
MANDYFQFKQFTVQQGKAALKVCTDACLLGAYAANYLQHSKQATRNILDIGTGTGLLSLMLAQKTTATIHAVEVDKSSYEQAKENFEASSWREKLEAFHGDIKDLKLVGRYDAVICNPPFFEQSLKSVHASKNLSKHVDQLPLSNLAEIAVSLLNTEAVFFILLPSTGFDKFIPVAKNSKLHLKYRVDIRQTKTHNFFRSIGVFSTNEDAPLTEEMSIKNEANAYTHEFVALLKDYYLHL